MAAKNAADQDEWPLGNDGPSVSAIGLSVGRARSASSLTVVVISPLPATTSAMNGITQRLRVRIVSAIATSAASAITTLGSPTCEIAVSTSVAKPDALRSPHSATPLSIRTTSVLPRTR